MSGAVTAKRRLRRARWANWYRAITYVPGQQVLHGNNRRARTVSALSPPRSPFVAWSHREVRGRQG